MKNDPESDINEYFDMLEFTQKSFIVEGMRNIMKEEKNEAKMKVVIDMLENRMMNETKSDRVVKEASEVSEKMNNIIQNKGAFQTPIRSSKSAIGILNSTPRDRERAIRSRASSVRFSLNIEDDIAHAIAEEKKKHSDQEIISPENIPESDEPINTLKISNEQTLSKHQNTSDKQYLNRRMIPPQSRSGSHTKGASLRRNYS
ncbi:hypothetical protein TRFO_03693 [Tritrichomonas foetus]|uniref:Uncharacterized protein n=1 Tax=Tritrichomonas foetus TaxID=1144522 RepID=A0A1J4KL96_9EUKA|nr:hypothetical protein TRFO_03693 [Tritrichomonas foetus]|eukprot:OHT12079.1 hypothetical protein TRFO_03693 [Tritrichomonas foetus]